MPQNRGKKRMCKFAHVRVVVANDFAEELELGARYRLENKALVLAEVE